MKRIIYFCLFLTISLNSFAQLKVESSGRSIAGTKLMTNSNWTIGFQSGLSSISNSNIAAIYGKAANNSSGIAYGVFGAAGISSGGSGCFGVAGCLESGSTGAGVLGSTYHITNMGLSSSYAGYFIGNARVTGTLTVNTLVQNSDYRLKDNIVSLSSQKESFLDKILDIDVVEYNYKPLIPSLILPDSVSTKEVLRNAGFDISKKHYGVIAQELQELFPTLVEENQDGYLGVNYVELVPVLVRAIQELKAQVDALQGNAEQATNRALSTTGVNSLPLAGNVLYQNTPNPFNEQTTIRFKLSDNAQNASICIFDMQGKMLKNIAVSLGMDNVTINSSELGKGMFLYSLLINGQEIDTKKMIISK